MKKIISLLLIFCTVFCPAVYAKNDGAVCVIEAQTGEVVNERNSVARLPMASTTKIMTCITAIESCNLDEVVTVSDNASRQEGSSAYLGAGYQLTMFDLLCGLMLNSGNDAAVAVAEHVSGTVEEFAKLMNDKAKEIGVGNTNFTNPNGLPDDEHYTTAYDLAMITRYAMKNDAFREIVSKGYHKAEIVNEDIEREFVNHNKLLSSYEGCVGVKTGFTKAAGRCLVSAAERDGIMFIAVTLNDPNDWRDHRAMLDSAFSKYSMRDLITEGEKIPYSDYDLVYGNSLSVPVKNGGKIRTKVDLHIPKTLKLPVAAGEKIGYADIILKDTVIGRVDICSAVDLYEEEKAESKFIRRIKYLIDKILL